MSKLAFLSVYFLLIFYTLTWAVSVEDPITLDKEVFSLFQMGKYKEALPLALRSLEIRQNTLSAGHSDIALSLNNVAAQYQGLGDYANAIPFFEKSIEIWKITLGPEHVDVAAVMNNLGVSYFQTNNMQKAEQTWNEALAIYNKANDSSGLSQVKTNLSNLSLRNKSDESYGNTLDCSDGKKLENKDDIRFAVGCLNSRGSSYFYQGEMDKAKTDYIQALEISEKKLSPKHPLFATSLNNLASLYIKLRNYSEAEQIYLRSIEVYENILGTDCHELIAPLNSLAFLYNHKGEYGKALKLKNRAKQIQIIESK